MSTIFNINNLPTVSFCLSQHPFHQVWHQSASDALCYVKEDSFSPGLMGKNASPTPKVGAAYLEKKDTNLIEQKREEGKKIIKF